MTRYFAAITGRDYIKTDSGDKIPFWDLLDHQPGGWLTSIANIKNGIPKNTSRMFDCGAWTYRKEDYPVLKTIPVTPGFAYQEYLKECVDGDLLIAPDHMVLPGENNNKRRKINTDNAREFIEICDEKYVPTACIHGLTTEEKIDNLLLFRGMGYKSFAIGGLAARARDKTYCIESVTEIMKYASEEDRIHVLGLSAFYYAKQWIKLGVTSFDGASHFLRAMTAGYFYKDDGSFFIASKPKEITRIPRCNCMACSTVSKHGGDTRFYGNSLNNIGRAAHNLNKAIKVFMDYSTNEQSK